MRRIPHSALSALFMFLATLGLGANGVAHGPWQWQYENESTREEFRSFEQFLSSRPWIAEKLRKDPTLANNSDFLNDNKELRNFLNAHPFVQADLKQDPRAFMQGEQEFERWERERVTASSDANDASVAEFDQFLSNHPWIAKKLKEKPPLANDKDFLHDNSELAHFLNAHMCSPPCVRTRLGSCSGCAILRSTGPITTTKRCEASSRSSTSSWPTIRGSPKSCVRSLPWRTIRISCTTIRSCTTT